MQKHYSEEKLKLLKRASKLGLGTAYIDGAKCSKGDFIFLMDADFSHHVNLLMLLSVINSIFIKTNLK